MRKPDCDYVALPVDDEKGHIYPTGTVQVKLDSEGVPVYDMKGKPVIEVHKLAVEVSAFVCTQNGAMPELPACLKKQLAN